MTKKLLVLLISVFAFFTINAYAADYANIPACSVTLSGQNVDNTYRQFPLLQYRDIVYFPMTYHDCRFLGVSTDWNGTTNTLTITKENISGAYRDYNWEWKNSKSNKIDICKFNIIVNGKVIDNLKEEYPLLTFRDVTYFPLTWRFAVDEFGWEYSYDDKNGLVVTADNYICKTLDLPDLRNEILPNGATDGKYYYYTGNDKKVYRTPVDNTSENELIYTTAHNHYTNGGNNNITFTEENGSIYLSYRTGASMGTDYRCKINSDGTVTDSDEGSYRKSFVGGAEEVYDLDGFTVKVYRGGTGNSRVIYYKDGSDDMTEIVKNNIVFSEIRPLNAVSFNPGIHILGRSIYLAGYDKTTEGSSSLYKYDLLTETLALVRENIGGFFAFTGWDNDTSSDSEMVVYYHDGKMFRYSSASGKTIIINENSLPLDIGVCYEGTLYLHTTDGEKTVVEMYPNYGIGSSSGAHIFETTLPTNAYISGGMLVTCSFGDNGIRTCVFNNPSCFFRSSDYMNSFFIGGGKLLYTPDEETKLVEVDLNN